MSIFFIQSTSSFISSISYILPVLDGTDLFQIDLESHFIVISIDRCYKEENKTK